MKKYLPWPLAWLVLIVVTLAGCSNHEVDTAKLRSAFQTVDAGLKAEVDQGIADITASNYSAALVPLKHVSYAAKLTKEQRDILEDSIQKLQAKAK
jgi:hypothetical protein